MTTHYHYFRGAGVLRDHEDNKGYGNQLGGSITIDNRLAYLSEQLLPCLIKLSDHKIKMIIKTWPVPLRKHKPFKHGRG